MQINLFNPIVKYLTAILVIVIIFALWFNGCGKNNDEPKLVKVTVPETKGTFKLKKPEHAAYTRDSLVFIKGDIVYTKNPINKKLIAENQRLIKEFSRETDSLKKEIMFAKVAKLNSFTSKFEDDNILINVEGVVQGEVQEITPNYKIKKKTVEVAVKPKETVFRILTGVELGNNTDLSNQSIKGNIMLQNRKGNIISAGYDSNKNYWVGYNISIFNYKK